MELKFKKYEGNFNIGYIKITKEFLEEIKEMDKIFKIDPRCNQLSEDMDICCLKDINLELFYYPLIENEIEGLAIRYYEDSGNGVSIAYTKELGGQFIPINSFIIARRNKLIILKPETSKEFEKIINKANKVNNRFGNQDGILKEAPIRYFKVGKETVMIDKSAGVKCNPTVTMPCAEKWGTNSPPEEIPQERPSACS